MRVTFQTTACRPVRNKDGEIETELYRAGHTYTVPDNHPSLAQWLSNNNAFPEGGIPKGQPKEMEVIADGPETAIGRSVDDTRQTEENWRRGRNKKRPEQE